MLPFHTNITKLNKTIYINPNFKGQLTKSDSCASFQTTPIIPANAHINPLFLEAQKSKNAIHMNPAFLHKLQEHRKQQQEVVKRNMPDNESNNLFKYKTTDFASTVLCGKRVNTETRKIICKSKNRLIREPLTKREKSLKLSKHSFPSQPLLVLNKCKLVRKVSIVPRAFNKSDKKSVNNCKTRITKYKLDNRVIGKKPLLPPTPRIKLNSYVGRYALKRTVSETLNTSGEISLAANKSKNKKLQVLNINGLLYKSTQNSLKLKGLTTRRILKTSEPNTSNRKLSNPSQGMIVFVRGDKYVMDANKFKLTRVTSCDYNTSNGVTSENSIKSPTCKRIDIGGYTYVSLNSAKNILIRTTNHLSRAYVHNAKQKSLQTLTKSLVKTNIPCPIFQRIGKCAAFERGKCSKVHNQLQIAICTKFLRGECLNSNCLLSHNVSLSKMPVCKFFLQGVCVRNDCPYLHKKLSSCAELCTEFLRGFCQMADKCNKRHEFTCPEIERNSICTTKNCAYCNAKKRKESQIVLKSEKLKKITSKLPLASISTEVAENQCSKRYFKECNEKTIENTNESNSQCINEDTANNTAVTEYSEENIENIHKTRPKLGALPSYIPL